MPRTQLSIIVHQTSICLNKKNLSKTSLFLFQTRRDFFANGHPRIQMAADRHGLALRQTGHQRGPRVRHLPGHAARSSQQHRRRNHKSRSQSDSGKPVRLLLLYGCCRSRKLDSWPDSGSAMHRHQAGCLVHGWSFGCRANGDYLIQQLHWNALTSRICFVLDSNLRS